MKKLFLFGIFFVAVFLVLAINIKAADACTVPHCYDLVNCDGSYCASASIACDCYSNGGCIVVQDTVITERYCEDNTHYYILGCPYIDTNSVPHYGGYWGPYVCPSGQICSGGYCYEPSPTCTIDSVSITSQCSGTCEQSEEILVSISYSNCPSNAKYIQIDAMSEDGLCTLEYESPPASIQGIEVTCDGGGTQQCTKTWQIPGPDIPSECEGKEIFAWAVGLYDDSSYDPSHWVTGISTSFPPGYGSFTFAGGAQPEECEIIDADTVTYCSGGLTTECDIGEIIEFDIIVENIIDCQQEAIDEIEIWAEDGGIEFDYSTSTFTTSGNTYSMEYIVSQSDIDNFGGLTFTTNHVAILSGGSFVDDLAGEFGQFTFSEEGVSPTGCEITNALIIPNCGNDGVCDNGDIINLRVTVEDSSKCKNVDKIEVDAFITTAQPNGCWKVIMDAIPSQSIRINGGTTYSGNWVVEIPPDCLGYIMVAKNARILNESGTRILDSYTNSAGFGTFEFAELLTVEDYNLSVDTCGDETIPVPDGICEDYDNVKGEITVNDIPWGIAPQWKLVDEGDYIVSFGDVWGWHEPGSVGVFLPPNVSLMGIYTLVPVDYALVIVQARNEQGEYIGALIELYIEGYLNPVAYEINEVSYEYIGNYPITFTAEFGDVAEYITPSNAEITIYADGIYLFTYIYEEIEEGACNCDYNEIVYDCGECIIDQPLYCKDVNGQGQIVHNCSVCDCPSNAPDCNQNGYCVQSPTVCHARTSSIDCHAMPFCFWDEPRTPMLAGYWCEACFAVNGIPQTCSDYVNLEACSSDPCHIGPSASQCNVNNGGQGCHCEWDSTAQQCNLIYQVTSTDPIGTCDISVYYGSCEDGCLGNINHRLQTYTCIIGGDCTGDICEALGYDPPYYTKTECIPCAVLFRPMPFFSWWNVLVVIALLVIVYAFILKRKK